MSTLAIIGGSGLSQLPGLKVSHSQSFETPYGKPSADFIHGELGGKTLIFLARHGHPHHIAPHKINYRANIWGLKQLGVNNIIAVAAVGGITSEMAPAHLVIPDQIIDYSYGREHTFFADDDKAVQHIDFTTPYQQQLRQDLIQQANNIPLLIGKTGTYGCTQGPRLESAAEIKRLEQDGCDVVGMTGMPEAALAKELNIPYAAINVIANWAAGKSAGEISMEEIEHHLKNGMENVNKLLTAFILNQADYQR